MKPTLLVVCLILSSILFAHEGGGFATNHLRFVTQHLPRLLDNKSGKLLLIGTSDLICLQLRKQFPLIECEEISLWDKNSWNKIIEKQNWNEYFDCVVAMNILERDPNREQILQMIFDILKLEGKALIYVDPQDGNTFDQRIEQSIRYLGWNQRIPITPSLSLSGHQLIIEKTDFHILDQSHDEYKIYFQDPFAAFLSVLFFACPRWPVPRTEWDEEMFAGRIRDCLNHRSEVIKVPDACPIFNSWIEDSFPTYYFIIHKHLPRFL